MVLQRVPPQLSKEVLYIGSAVPFETSEGLEAVQQPLRLRYPVDNDDHIQGIFSTVTILPSGIQLKYKDDPSHVVLFPFSTLTLCAAVRCVKTTNAATNEVTARFVSLSSPEAGGANIDRPSIFTCITRRTRGRQVLECHGFLTMSPQDAMDLVQWTSMGDQRFKNATSPPAGGAAVAAATQLNSTYEASRGDASFRGETASLPDFPIQIVPGEPVVQNAGAGFYKEPPKTGYFYSTSNSQVKKYSVQKLSGGGGVAGDNLSMPPHDASFERRPGYAPSHYSMPPAGVPPPGAFIHPMRGFRPPPPMMRPVLVPPPPPHPLPMYGPYPRPRFFSPPPPVMRPQPMPVFVGGPPPPPGVFRRPHRRDSRGSSRSSSSSSSSSETVRMNGQAPHSARPTTNGDAGEEDSSTSSSRPVTPPTDYDAPRGPRISRRDEYYMRQSYLKERNGPAPSPRHSPGPRRMRGPPQGFYMIPQYGGYYGFPPPPPPGMIRSRSVPPYGARGGKKEKKKSKKVKKEKKSKKQQQRASAMASDVSTDSVGYTSELGPAGVGGENKQPRDFRRAENQFQHERAFSKSLREETRKSTHDPDMLNPYALNRPEEGEFPMYS